MIFYWILFNFNFKLKELLNANKFDFLVKCVDN